MVSDVTLTGAATNAQKTQNQGLKLAEDFSQFLTLLTTQLQNQDPLNPMDSSEFTNQLVQFSQVEQAINSNQKLDNLVGMQLATMPSIGLNYVGMDITYRSIDLNYDGTNPTKISYALNTDAATAELKVLDEDGKLIFSTDVPNDPGSHEYTWDGSMNGGSAKAPPGTYTVRIDAFDSEEEQIDVSTAVTGRVRGIEAQDGLVFLLVGERAVALNNVINANKPPETITATP